MLVLRFTFDSGDSRHVTLADSQNPMQEDVSGHSLSADDSPMPSAAQGGLHSLLQDTPP